jgi:hypothetical protein
VTTLTFHIHLIVTEPLISRTFKVLAQTTMYELHHIIQVVAGWSNSHLYQFNVGEKVMADHRLVDDELGPVMDVKRVIVTQVFTKLGTTLTYEYDFGDSWIHHLELVEISTHPINEMLPQIVGGEHACPPEDCGGSYRYRELKEILLNPKYPEYKRTKRWVGSKFDPMVCDMKTIRKN